MAEEERPRKEKKKKSKSKHVDIDGDEIDREVSKAMRQVEKAMSQVKLAEKEARQARKMGKQSGGDFAGMHIHTQLPGPGIHTGEGGTVFHNNTTTNHGTYINIESAQNVQIGNHNTMVINKTSRKKKKSRRRKSESGDEEEDSGEDDDAVVIRQEQTELEKLPIFSSKRVVSPSDIDTICVRVSNWRRFLRFLNLEEANIEHVYEENFHRGGVKECLMQGIKMWQRKEAKGATIDIVARALLRIECSDVVRELQP